MAEVRRNLATKAKAKPTVTRAQSKSIDYRFIGSEPIDIRIKGYSSALNWYNYMYDADQAREWLLEYMTKKDYPVEDIAFVKKAPKTYFPSTVGWVARIMMNGNSVESMDYFNSRVEYLIEMGKKEKSTNSDDAPKEVVNIQERTRAKNRAFVSDVISEVDENLFDFQIYEFLKSKEATASMAMAVREEFIGELNDVMCDDAEVKTSYGSKLKKYREFWSSFINDIDRFVNNTKATKVRKPREKKMKSAVDVVKDLKFMKEFTELKIASVNPAEIIGASQVWIYNVKYKRLSRLTSSSTSGLQVKGTTIVNLDEAESVAKTLRKPDLVLSNLLSAGKVTMRKFMEDIKTTESPATGRMNEDTIIVKVVK